MELLPSAAEKTAGEVTIFSKLLINSNLSTYNTGDGDSQSSFLPDEVLCVIIQNP